MSPYLYDVDQMIRCSDLFEIPRNFRDFCVDAAKHPSLATEDRDRLMQLYRRSRECANDTLDKYVAIYVNALSCFHPNLGIDLDPDLRQDLPTIGVQGSGALRQTLCYSLTNHLEDEAGLPNPEDIWDMYEPLHLYAQEFNYGVGRRSREIELARFRGSIDLWQKQRERLEEVFNISLHDAWTSFLVELLGVSLDDHADWAEATGVSKMLRGSPVSRINSFQTNLRWLLPKALGSLQRQEDVDVIVKMVYNTFPHEDTLDYLRHYIHRRFEIRQGGDLTLSSGSEDLSGALTQTEPKKGLMSLFK